MKDIIITPETATLITSVVGLIIRSIEKRRLRRHYKSKTKELVCEYKEHYDAAHRSRNPSEY